MKRILMVLQSDFPPDMRVQKEALSLISAGNRVVILCDNRIKNARKSLIKGIEVIRIKHFSAAKGKVHHFINLPVYPNPVWLSAIAGTVQKIKADVIHVHDLPLALSALHVSAIYNIPLIIDLHENYPAALKQWYKPGIAGWTIRNPKISAKVERFCLKRSKRVVVIDNVHKKLLIKRGIEAEKIFVVPNVPSAEFINYNKPDNDFKRDYGDTYNLVYFGKLNPERNLELALRAMPELKNRIPSVRLIIAGDGPHRQILEKLIRFLKIENSVQITGWLNVEDAVKFIDIADICIIPHFSNDNMDIGVPNKLFEYMAREKPVVVPRSEAIAHVVSKVNCGVIFKPDSLDSYINAVIKIYDSDFNYGYFGRKAVEQEYNWNNAEKELFRAYSGV